MWHVVIHEDHIEGVLAILHLPQTIHPIQGLENDDGDDDIYLGLQHGKGDHNLVYTCPT
jgi:hypothetical protein